MILLDQGRIEMTASEFELFAEATFAPWKPRTIREFNAMCELGIARHMAENVGGMGFMDAIAIDAMKFGEDGTPNFPMDQRKLAYVKEHGNWPSDEQLREWLAAGGDSPKTAGLSLVKSPPK